MLIFASNMAKSLTLVAPNRIQYILRNWDMQKKHIFNESGVLKVNIKVLVSISMLFILTTIWCTSVIIETFSWILSGSVLASSQFLTPPFELLNDLCTATGATLPN